MGQPEDAQLFLASENYRFLDFSNRMAESLGKYLHGRCGC